MAESQQGIEAAAESLKAHLQDQGQAINAKKKQGPGPTILFL